MQLEYSLVAREIESEHLPAAREAGMGVVPWSPLAGGLLSAKYRRGDTADVGRLSGPNPFGNSKFTDRNWAILEQLEGIANELGRPPAQVAIAWTLSRAGVESTLVGARTSTQLQSNLAATEIRLSDEQKQRLDKATAPSQGFGSGVTWAHIRRMVFGGHDVTGWDDGCA